MSEVPMAIVRNDKLYVIFQALGHNGTLRYMVLEGSSWTGSTEIPNVGIASPPSTLIVNGIPQGCHQNVQALVP
jgi:hypothetical protein